MTIEFTEIEQQVVQGLRRGNEILAELQNEMKLGDIELLMEETAEAVAYQNVLGSPYRLLRLIPRFVGNISSAK